MSGTMLFIIVVFLICGYWIYLGVDEWFFAPKRNTRPPVNKILDLVAKEDGFEISVGWDLRYPQPPESVRVDYSLVDTVNKTVSWLYQFDGHVTISGEFEWFNKYEKSRLYHIISNIVEARTDKSNTEAATERERRYEKKRKESISTYQDR